jgi:molybdopterin-synthase adenylyltransferase
MGAGAKSCGVSETSESLEDKARVIGTLVLIAGWGFCVFCFGFARPRRTKTTMIEHNHDRVLIVGAGGLGVPAAMALARAGKLDFGLIDPDCVELSNLPRQVLYSTRDCGTPKVTAAARRLRDTHQNAHISTHLEALTAANAVEIIDLYGFIIDATDDPATKFLINDTCIRTGRPFVYAGVLGMTGQAMTIIPGQSACLRCLFEEPPGAEEIASCRDAGIVGPVAGAIGEIEAAEALRWVGGQMPTLVGKMLTYNAINSRIRLTTIATRPGCECGAANATLRLGSTAN